MTNEQSLSIKDDIVLRRDKYANTLASTVEADRFVQMAVATICGDPKLQPCTRESILECLMQGASLKLMPGKTLGLIHFVPFNKECTIIIGYKGLTTLAYRSGNLEFVTADVVYEKDKFDYELGSDPYIKFQKSEERDRGAKRGAFCIWKFKSGGQMIDYAPMADLMQVRAMSAAVKYNKKDSPWFTREDEMFKKTIVRRAAKLLDISPDLSTAIAFEDEQEARLIQTAKPEMEREHVTDAEWRETLPIGGTV